MFIFLVVYSVDYLIKRGDKNPEAAARLLPASSEVSTELQLLRLIYKGH